MRTPGVWCCAALITAGCAVGPNFHKPAPPQALGYQPVPLPGQTASADVAGGAGQRFVENGDIPGQWWTLFHSPELDELIRQALRVNPDVRSGQAALRGAWENVYAQRGYYWPAIEANITPTRQRMADILSSNLASGANIYSLTTAQVTVSYVPDVFGANRRAVESLEAQAESQRCQLLATYLTLTSSLVAAVVEDAALAGQIEATQSIIEDQSQTLASFRRQRTLGQVAEADVAAQETLLAQAQATLPPLSKQLAQQHDLIVALAGSFPDHDLAAIFDHATLQLPADLPVSLPARLVEQRPDVRAAEAQLHSASAQIGVALANRLPNIQIDGGIGNSATAFSGLLKTDTYFWNVAASITQPIFAGGTLMHRQRAARAAYDQAAAQYESTVIAAVQNVADTLHAIQSDADALRAAVTAERAAARSLEFARSQLKLGDISRLSFLATEQAYQQTRIGLVTARANRLADSAALFQALGGGWWNNRDMAYDVDKRTAGSLEQPK